MVEGSLNGGVDRWDGPREMRLGTDVVSMRDGLVIYAKFEQRAFDALRRRDLLDAFNRYCDTSRGIIRYPHRHQMKPRALVKRANKFLKRHRLPVLQPLTFLEVSAIASGGDPPVGCLLARYRDEGSSDLVNVLGLQRQ